MPTMNLGQVFVKTVLKISTRLNTKTTGLTDVLIDIYNPSGGKAVDNGVMTELGTEGIYQYAYTIPNTVGTYTAVITCVSQRNYDELQTFVGTTMQGGGGMVVQYPAKVINQDEIKQKKKLMELLIKIDERLGSLMKKSSKKDIKQTEDEIKKKIDQLNKDFKSVIDKNKESTDDKIEQYATDSSTLMVNGIADFTSKIYKLEENTKLLPNSLNSLLVSAQRYNTSKFEELQKIIKSNDENSRTFTSKFSNDLGNKNKMLDSKVDSMNKDLSLIMDKAINEVSLNSKEIKEGILSVSNQVDQKNGLLKSYMELFGRIKEIAPKVETYNTFLSDKFTEIEQKVLSLNSMNLHLLNMVKDNEQNTGFMSYAEKMKDDIMKLNKEVDSFKNDTMKSISKIPDKRDLNYTQEHIVGNIKELQSNNTKKVKELRDNIESTKTQIEDRDKKLKRQMKISEEENNLNAQLSGMNQSTKE